MKTIRLFALLLVLVMAFGMLAACGDDPVTPPTVGPNDGNQDDPNQGSSDGYKTADDVYNEWWKLYIQRWNTLVPEVPLYSNQYFDLYNGKISNFVTTPYWGPADAIIAATSTDGAVILGSATQLSGAFRDSSWGKASPGASDLDIQNMTTGHSTVMTNKEGAMIWNTKALNGTPVQTKNADGTMTYTIKINQGMKFSDGSAITAKNYIVSTLANSTAVSVAAGGTGVAGNVLVGYEAFNKYEGTGEQVYFEGVKLIDDYTFSITVLPDYAGYYYAMQYAAFSPVPLSMYMPAGEIITNDAKECAISTAFYAKETVDGTETFAVADDILNNLKWNSALPYSGPYTVSNYDDSTRTATLTLNTQYNGDDARGKASITTITYIEVVTETQMNMFTSGQVDVIAGITGAAETKAALDVVNGSNGAYKETHYDRAGYGKLGFRADFGPTAMKEVRQAIMYTINRSNFAKTFTGGYGSVVHGPYYTGSASYKAVEDEILLNDYAYNVDDAIKTLVAGGWIYNVDGSAYDAAKGGIRYKKLSGYELTADNIAFKTTDNAYATVKIGNDYYMPLAINYFGTQPNDVTDQLLTAWANSENATTKIGMYIVYTATDFNTGLYGELNRMPGYGYDGTPKVNAINFATGFNSAIYDFAFNWSINPMYEPYSAAFIFDEADYYENYHGAVPTPDANGVVKHQSTESVYDKIGAFITIDMVEEDENGIAYVTYEGVKYELGMDFLSMAMVYNVTVPEAE